MKSILFILLFTLSFGCSAMGGKSVKLESQLSRERKPQDKIWRPCQDFEVNQTESRNPIGKLCNRVCLKRSGSSCLRWKQNIKDFTIKDDFMFFRNGSFVFIDEDLL